MRDRLPTIVAGIDNDPISRIEPFLPGDRAYRDKESTGQRRLLFLKMREGWNRLPRNYEDVDRGCRVDVANGDDIVILIDEGCRNFPVDDSGKKGLLGHGCSVG